MALRQSTEDVVPFHQDLGERFWRMMGGAPDITSMDQLQDLATTLGHFWCLVTSCAASILVDLICWFFIFAPIAALFYSNLNSSYKC